MDLAKVELMRCITEQIKTACQHINKKRAVEQDARKCQNVTEM